MWVNNGAIVNSFKVLELERPEIITLKSYYYETTLCVACGLENGTVMLASQNSVIDSVPEQQSGKITGIEMLQYGNKDYFVIFRENPGSLSVFHLSDSDSDFYEEYFTELEENISLVQMSTHQQSAIFLLTLNSTLLTVSFYNGSNRLETLYSHDFTREELRNLVTFALPDNSFFYNSREFGCELSMVSRGGTEVQYMTLTNCREEALFQELAEACVEKTIWQRPEMQSRIIRDLEAIGIDKSDYSDEDLKMMDLMVGQRKAALIGDFLSRKIGNNYVVAVDLVNFVTNWLKTEFEKRKELVENEMIPMFLQENADLKGLCTAVEEILDEMYEYLKIASVLKIRQNHCPVYADIEKLVFVLRTTIWIVQNSLLEIFAGMNWNRQRDRLNDLSRRVSDPNAVNVPNYSTSPVLTLFLDEWTSQMIPELLEEFKNSISKNVIFTMLVHSSQDIFCKVFLYLLLVIELETLELKGIHLKYISEFILVSEVVDYVKGCWLLDMFSHQNLLPDENSESQAGVFQQFAKDAL